ncbi:aldo-keto reductase family 1 member C23-like protein [Trichechus inunguis]
MWVHHITLQELENEEDVGWAIQSTIADDTVKREDIFCTSKPGEELYPKDEHGKIIFDKVNLCATWEVSAWGRQQRQGSQEGATRFMSSTCVPFNGSISHLILVLCSHHTNYSSQLLPLQDLEKCKDVELAKCVGVFNFNCRQLEMILNKPRLRYQPVYNQVECHPYLNQSKLLDFCKLKYTVLVAYSALESP